MCPNFTCVFTLCPSIFMHNIYLGYEITDVGRGVIFKKLLLTTYIHFFKKPYFKNCLQQSIILTYQVFCVLNPWSLQGSHDSLLPSINRHLEKFTTLTNQIFHTLKMSLYASVCNNTVVMWPFFIELIASFCVKITQGNFL